MVFSIMIILFCIKVALEVKWSSPAWWSFHGIWCCRNAQDISFMYLQAKVK